MGKDLKAQEYAERVCEAFMAYVQRGAGHRDMARVTRINFTDYLAHRQAEQTVSNPTIERDMKQVKGDLRLCGASQLAGGHQPVVTDRPGKAGDRGTVLLREQGGRLLYR